MQSFFVSLLVLIGPTAGFVQDSVKVAVLKQSPPESVAAAVRDSLSGQGFRLQDDHGHTIADIWLRKAIPVSEKPGAPNGAVLFPFLVEGELVGVLQFATEGHDYRDQPIAKGVYTMRYGLQPVNGDHLGVSTYRDYSLVLPAAKDRSLAPLPRKQLEERSAESAGTSHPAVFLLLAAPATASKSDPSVIRDAEKNTWSVVLPLTLRIKGQNDDVPYPVRFVVIGAAPA